MTGQRSPRWVAFLLVLVPVTAAAFIPSGAFILKRATRAAKARQGLVTSYEVRVPRRSKAVLRIAGRKAEFDPSPAPPRLELIRAMLAGNSREALALAGAESDPTSLARADGRVAVVLGAGNRREPVNQVWFDQERFTPLYARTGDLEIRFLGTDELPSVAGLPLEIEVRRAGQTLWRARMASQPVRP